MKQPEPTHRPQPSATRTRWFFLHFFIFIGVNLLLFLIDLLGGGGWWIDVPLIVWGIVLLGHALAVFGIGRLTGPAWQEQRLRQQAKAEEPEQRQE